MIHIGYSKGLSVDISWDYVAGFFDGEGSVGFQKKKGRMYPRITFTQKNPKILELIRTFIGYGTIYGTHSINLEIDRHEDCLELAEKLIPRTFVKRDALMRMVQFIKNRKWKPQSRKIPIKLNKEEFEKLYLHDKLSASQMSGILGCHKSSIYYRLKTFSIPRRNNREARLIYLAGQK
jgi:hypothetical protein